MFQAGESATTTLPPEIKFTMMNILQISFHRTRNRATLNTGICGGSGEGQDMMSGSTKTVRIGGESKRGLIGGGHGWTDACLTNDHLLFL